MIPTVTASEPSGVRVDDKMVVVGAYAVSRSAIRCDPDRYCGALPLPAAGLQLSVNITWCGAI